MASTSGTSDSLMVIGGLEPHVRSFLERIGYTVQQPSNELPLPEQISKSLCDLIVIEAQLAPDVQTLCEYLRDDKSLRNVPIVVVGERAQLQALQERHYQRIEFVETPFSLGRVVSKIATQLRLRKMAGGEAGATLGDLAAAQRDLSARIHRELEEARAIQQSLLPREMPTDPRFELAVHYKPLEEVGGDWYFAQRETSGALSLQVADVTGHGLSAAFIGSMTKLAFFAADDESPEARLQEMNRLLTPQIPEGRFVTLIGAHYEPQSGLFRVARGGHPPALWYSRKEGVVRQLNPNGFAMGFFPDSSYTCDEATIAPDDVMVLFTDGIVEAQDRNGECYGIARLSHAMQTVPVESSAQDILRRLMADFEQFIDGRIVRDDLTMLVLRRTLVNE